MEEDDEDGKPVILNYEPVDAESKTDQSRRITYTESASSTLNDRNAQSLHQSVNLPK